MPDATDALHDLERRIGYEFLDVANLVAALTHASAVDVAQPRKSERLEFLGDAVLGLVLSDLLTERYPEFDEGQLSKSRAALVSTASFASKARELGLNQSLNLGKGEEKTGGREKTSILAAVYEAVMGAIFKERGYEVVRELVGRHFGEAIEAVSDRGLSDPKTELQEICQRERRVTPVYRVIQETGPDHARRFVVSVLLGDEVLASGEGPSKRAAEQEAARRALQDLFAAPE
jgi:ribonuclease III